MNDRGTFAVAGRPVLHSLSPRLFRAAAEASSTAGAYLRLSAGIPREALRLGRELGLSGMNVTAPLKAGVFELLDSVDGTAAALGAVNTLVREGEAFRGYNTDPAGVVGALAAAGVGIRGRRCLVLGAGGAGRAAVLGLREGGAEVVLCNRPLSKARDAARAFGVPVERWGRRSAALARAEVLVSALPPEVDAVAPDWLRPELVVLEAAYPSPPLTTAASAAGCRVVRGENWLVHQAVPAFRLFTGFAADPAALAEALETSRPLPPPGPLKIALIGFMGSGKTAVGRLLARKLGWAFEDTDAWIERRAGGSVAEIFRRNGEASFRDLEADALRGILAGPGPLVCACGGGSVLRPENRALIARHALAVWLHAAPAVCLARIDPATRPLLAGLERGGDAFGDLFRARISCYAEVAELVVGSETNEERTVRVVHEEIRRVFHG